MSTIANNITQEKAIAALIATTDKKTNQYPNRKNSFAYKTALAALQNLGEWQVCGTNVGSGKFASSKSWQQETFIALMRANIKAEICNIAPKGGKNGDRIRVILSPVN